MQNNNQKKEHHTSTNQGTISYQTTSEQCGDGWKIKFITEHRMAERVKSSVTDKASSTMRHGCTTWWVLWPLFCLLRPFPSYVCSGEQCVRICSIPQLKSFKMRKQFSSQMAGHPGRGYEYFITRPGWVGTPCLPGTPRRDFVSALFACRALPGTLCMCVCMSAELWAAGKCHPWHGKIGNGALWAPGTKSKVQQRRLRTFKK